MAYSDFSENYMDRSAGLRNFLNGSAQPASPIAAPITPLDQKSPLSKFLDFATEAFTPGHVQQNEMQAQNAAPVQAETPFRDTWLGAMFDRPGSPIGNIFDAQRRGEIQKYSDTMPSDPLAAMKGYARITGDIKPMMKYIEDQADPLKKLQMQAEQMQINNARAVLDERKRMVQQQGALTQLFQNPTQGGAPENIPASGIGPVRPAVAPTALSQLELADRMAAIDPEHYADNALAAREAQKQDAPATAGLPEGYMWKDGTAVPIPGVPTTGTGFTLPKGVSLPQGTVAVADPTSPVGFKVEPIPGAQRSTTDFKEYQLKPAGFASRMVNAENIVKTLDKTAQEAARGTSGYTANIFASIPSFGIGESVAKGIVSLAATPEQQQYLNAAQEWIRAKLRKESGAVISPKEEFSEYETYFPKPTDSPELIAQKEQLRAQASESMIKESNGAYETLYPELAGPPHQPTTQKEFDDLPKNAMFINPKDGKLMRKK